MTQSAALDRLAEAMARTNETAMRGLDLNYKELTAHVRALKALTGGVGGGGTYDDGPIKEAIRQFLRRPELTGLPQARLLSFGCTLPIAPHYILIEDLQRFPRFLDGVDRYHTIPKVFRRCYRGLLSNYFSYDPEGAEDGGLRNWETLRVFLEQRLSALEQMPRAEWIPVLRKHHNLLGTDPCARYALKLLRDDESEFKEVQQKLEISDSSWIVRRLVLAQIRAAAAFSDEPFKALTARLLHLITEHPLLRDEGLALILNRYCECSVAPALDTLRDAAVDAWGNPWLSHNSARWAGISSAAKTMVSNWLKLELIHQFFSLLAEDGTADTRRLKFWQRHHASIDDMYFALGNHATYNLSADFVELRKKMSGRVLQLYGAGSPENNAFIMCIAGNVVVEFGKSGNACFIFDRNKIPFALHGTVKGDTTALKHDSHRKRLIHIDSRWKKWEKKFEDEMPELKKGAGVSSTYQPTIGESRSTSAGAYSRQALDEFCLQRRLKIDDLSQKGSHLWVRAGGSNLDISLQLSRWGFKYTEGKGWWKA